MKDSIVIGIGNTLMKDDGIGVYAVRRLRETLPREVTTVEGGIYSVDLISYMEGYRKVLFIDGIDAGEDPGAIFRFTPDDLKCGFVAPVSVHDIGLPELIRDAGLLGQCPEEIVLFTIQVKEIGLGEELSVEVEQALPKLDELVMKELGVGLGHGLH